MEKEYPYLGFNNVDGKQFIVFFVEQDRGIVVLDDTDTDTIKFGMLSDFDEEQFDLLPKGTCVRLEN